MEKFVQFMVPIWYDAEWAYYPTCTDSDNVENCYNGETEYADFETAGVSNAFEIINIFSNNVSASYIYINDFKSQNEFEPTGSFSSQIGTMLPTGSDGLYIIEDFVPYIDYSLGFTPAGGNNTNEYNIKNVVYSKLFKVPMYDQDYVKTYSFSRIPFSSVNHTKTMYPHYGLSQASKLITEVSYTFSGLLESEKNVFLEMIDDFGNSFQPFFMLAWSGDTFTATHIILKNNIDISKDKFDLWKVSLNVVEIL